MSPLPLILLAAMGAPAAPAAESAFPAWLDTASIGAAAWRQAHPEWDGRGVAIAVLDTGVDMGVDGLRTLPGGGVKVVEARDFTGESVVECTLPSAGKDAEGHAVWRVRDGLVRGLDALPGLPAGGRVYLGFLDESRFRNTPLPDINGNGRTDDRFAVAVFQGADGRWRAALDRAGDHDLAGDPVVQSYGVAREFVRLEGSDPGRPTAPVDVALHIDASDDLVKRVEFHVPTASHGTHVAGIAAGWRLNGQAGYDGVAPGATVLSLKIGNNALSGGASVTDSMRKALEFAARWSRDNGTPLVANLSYGVGSEVEGQSDIERWIDRFVEENPQIVIVVSAGNEGPGLSTVGSPGGALGVLTVAAMLTPGMARDLMGADLPGERLFQFSARGGELAKPDVAAPGIAASSVPAWARGDVMRGTSMASPQGAGAAALLLSALKATRPQAPWTSGTVRRALRDGARPIPGYTFLDQGAGRIDVARSWDALQAAVKDADAAILTDLEVSTPAPTLPGHRGRAAFWRAGGWAPDDTSPARVTVRPRFAASASGADPAAFYRSFSLSADASWVRLSRSNVRLKGRAEATFDVWVDRGAVKAPGVHVATVTGRSGALSFRFPVTVVTPWRPRAVAGVPTVTLRGLKLSPGDLLRFPLSPPAGTSSVQVSAAATRDRQASVRMYLFDSHGRRLPADATIGTGRAETARATLRTGDLLEPGMLELDLYALPSARFASEVDVDVRFPALDAEPLRAFQTEPGLAPRATVEVVNRLDEPFSGSVKGQLTGCERTFVKTLSGDSLRETFHLSREFDAAEFELRMSAEDFGRFTDIALAVVDRDGKAVVDRDGKAVVSGMDYRAGRIVLRNPDAGRGEADYALVVSAGRAQGGGPPVAVTLVQRMLWKDPVPLEGRIPRPREPDAADDGAGREPEPTSGSGAGAPQVDLYPTVATAVEIRAAATPRACPTGMGWTGSLEFTGRRDGLPWLQVPVRVR